jgi:uncharacterized protein YigE (DUF2233 family)
MFFTARCFLRLASAARRARLKRAAPALLLLLSLDALSPGSAFAQSPAPCAATRFEGASYTVCTFDVRRDDIRIHWKGPDGKPYASFDRLADALAAQGRRLLFAMNGGMFETDLSPVGLLVENGKQKHRPDTREGDSNFHMKPNGVFYVADGVAGIAETGRFLSSGPLARYATQSGPMLVIDGRVHPKIHATGTSAKIRNGVGVRNGAEVVFAISNEPVTFYAFAELFREGLNCPNALFLDGTVSSLYAPDLNRDDSLSTLGPIISVSAPQPQ